MLTIDTLEIYRRIGVREVWIWQNQQFTVYCLTDGSYQKLNSKLLPDLDLVTMAQYVNSSDPLEAILEWRATIQNS